MILLLRTAKPSITQQGASTPRSLAGSVLLGFTFRNSLRTPVSSSHSTHLGRKQSSVKLKDTLPPLWTRMSVLLGILLGIPELISKTGTMPPMDMDPDW